jgi:DNA-directed RNA polymerase beta' subunit
MRVTIGVLSEEEVKSIASFQLNTTFDLSDPRFGGKNCSACREKVCYGHYAFLDLGIYVVHPMFKKDLNNVLLTLCPHCGAEVPSKKSKNYNCHNCGEKINDELLPTLEKEGIRDFLLENGFKEHKYILRYLLVPPPGIRPKDDDEWPSDLSYAYSLLVKEVSRDNPNALKIEKLYERVIDQSSKLMSGKEGIFRDIMKGKRLDKSSRSVVVGDPNIRLDQILVPRRICDEITIGERCFEHNVERLKSLASEGRVFWRSTDVAMVEGDIVQGQEYDRCLTDGDYVLFNRQPSLSKDSLMSFRVRVRKDDSLAIGINHAVAGAFNADFDGDEMNIFSNWGLMSQAELNSLCDVGYSRELRPIQDTLTGVHLLESVGIGTLMDCLTEVTEGGRRTVDDTYHLQRMINRWLLTVGFNVNVLDCMWSEEDMREKEKMKQRLNRQDFVEWTQKKCLESYEGSSIHKMIRSGGKGNVTNMSQIMACVGFQHIGDRTEFVESSFLEGLKPREFVVHSMAARRGVINTGVQTSTTGYLNRRASMLMADCQADYAGNILGGDRIVSFS